MAIQSMVLDPNAATLSSNDVIVKINTASSQITRASAVSAAARPIGSKEITASNIADATITTTQVAVGIAKASLDAMSATNRGYIKTDPSSGQFKIVGIQRSADGKLEADYDDVAV